MYRRRKKHQGADWTGEGNALKEDGVWCGKHGKRHGYKSKELGFQPEVHNGTSYIHWTCKATGEVLETVRLEKSEGAGAQLGDEQQQSGGSDTQDRSRPDDVDV